MAEKSVYSNNIKALAQVSPGFVKKLDETAITPEYLYEPAKKSGFTLKVGDKVFHSRIDPLKEAERLAEKDDFSGKDFLLVGSMGLGYLVPLLAERYSDKPILVVEKDWALLKLAFQTVDFSALFTKGQLEVAVLETPEDLLELLRGKKIKAVGAIFFRPAYEHYGDFYSCLKEVLTGFLSSRQINLATITRFEKLWFKNLIQNMGPYLYYQGVESLFGIFSKIPAFLIGAGPSLKKHIQYLKKLQEKYLIIAVNTSLPYLLEEEIIPDIVVTVDPQDKIFQYFLPVFRKKLPRYPLLVVEPTISAKITSRYPGPVLFCDPGFLEDWLASFSQSKGEMEIGGSVITAAFVLAKKMGADPIVFLGTDMAYSEKTLHFKGAELEKVWLYGQHRMNPLEHEHYIFLKQFNLEAYPGFWGEDVYTDVKFKTYIRWLERVFQGIADIRIVNCTEGGIAFKGIENIPLQKLLDQVDRHPVLDKARLLKSYANPEFKKEAGALLVIFEKMLGDLPSLVQLAREGQSLALRLYSKARSKQHLKTEWLKRLDNIDKELSQIKHNDIISMSIQKVIHQVTEELSGALTPEEIQNEDLKALRHSELLYAGIAESADFTLNQIKKAQVYLRNWMALSSK